VEIELSPLEQDLVAHVEAGEVLDCHTGGEITDAAMGQWGEDRSVRASVIREILLSRLAKDPDPHGVRIRGLRVSGELDLENVRRRLELSLKSCDIPEGVILRDAELAGVVFGGCRIGAGLAPGRASLSAERVTAEVLFLGVDRDTGRPFTAAGAVRLTGAHIGQLDMSGARLQGYDTDGSLIADNLHVDGSAFLRSDGERPFTAVGAVRLHSAHVVRQLDMSGAQLQGYNTKGDSLIADNLQVDGSAFLRSDGERPFITAGAVRLFGAHITGKLQLHPARLGGLDLSGATLGGIEVDPKSVQHAELTGLTYAGLPELGEADDWIDLFRRTEGYSPQPYQQLAAACRSAGHERDARRALIAQQDDRRDRLLRPPKKASGKPSDLSLRWRLWWRRFGLHLQKLALGYGYRARRAFYGTLIVLGTACAIGLAAGHTHSGSTGHYAAYRPPPTDGQPVQRCSTVEQIGLGLRPGLPFLSTVTAGKCVFDTATAIGGAYASIDWSLQALAWAGAALAIAGYTGLVRKT
jgi:uncharacterized protein YjbI with pentapeptide repeats